MNRDSIFYRMNTLMGLTEIDAFTAQKNIGSRISYFEALEEFIEAVPKTAGVLESLSAAELMPGFLDFVSDLQNDLMKIGAAELVWEAEKIAVLAREEDYGKCVGDAYILGSKLRALREKILDSKVDKPFESEVEAAEPISLRENEWKDKPQAAARPEQYEKLLVLIENFELDGALEMLRNLLNYTYGKDIDSAHASKNSGKQ